MNHRQLLIKYINHVGAEEGSTFLDSQGGWEDSVVFTEEEWDELKKLEAIDYDKLASHSCSCHVKNAGPCELCKVLGCEVWDFNQVQYADNVPMNVRAKYETGVDHGVLYIPPEGGMDIDGMHVPPHGFFGIRGFKWGTKREKE